LEAPLEKMKEMCGASFFFVVDEAFEACTHNVQARVQKTGVRGFEHTTPT